MLGLTLAGCSSLRTVHTVVDERVEGRALLVQLEAAEPGLPVQYAHPVDDQELAPRLDAMLAELAFGRPKGRRLTRLMEPSDRTRLADGLARALVGAGPRERVRFLIRIEDDAHTPWITPTQRLTRGVAFVDVEGRFNLAFDLLDDRVDPRELNPGEPTKSAQTRARIVSETGEDRGPAEDGSRRLWVSWQLEERLDSSSAPELDDSVQRAKLELLEELLAEGIIDADEFEARRARLLDSSGGAQP